MSRCEECEKKKISMDRMATILSQQSNDWHKQRERIAELEARDKKAVELLDEAIQVTFSQKAYCMMENYYSGESQCAELIDEMRLFISEGGADEIRI